MKRLGARKGEIAIGIVLVVLGLGAVLWLLPMLLVALSGGQDLTGKDRVDAIANERRTVLAVLAGTAAAVGLFYTARNHQLDRDSNVTERYTRAVEQLGHDSIAIRLGGLYSLDRIAVDSERDRDTILEVMCAFIRDRTRTLSSEPPDTDVAAALTLITRKDSWIRSPIALAGAKLAGAKLTGANLTGANLTGASVYRADLIGADLSSANLHGAGLTGADLSSAILSNADLIGADLTGARLSNADLAGADLSRGHLPAADLTGAILHDTYLETVCLARADLSGADLIRADLTRADLTGARFIGADLSSADLSSADLSSAENPEDPHDTIDADLSHAKLHSADLTGANLTDAKLHGADLTEADLTDAKLHGADLTEADLTDAKLHGADLTEADLSRADLTDVPLIGDGRPEIIGFESIIGLGSATGVPPEFSDGGTWEGGDEH